MAVAEHRSVIVPAEPRSLPPGAARLRDGTPVRVREACPDDDLSVRRFLEGLSVDSLERRFFTAIRPDRAVREILRVGDTRDRLSLLVERLDPGDRRVIGHGEYVRYGSDGLRAEVAFLVADDHQGLGVGTLLLLSLARRARKVGIVRFEAVVQSDNSAMLDVFFGAGFPCAVRWHEGEGLVSMEIAREPVTSILPWTGSVSSDTDSG
jgi:GNAT superfamily N-acetyltransferase